MDFTLIFLATTSINFIITISFVYRTYKIMMELFHRQEKYNFEVRNDIKNIFEIIKYNGLVRPKQRRTSNMKCTNKEQETCDVEKRGCEGCYYNEKTADEMFEELGYTEIEKYKNGIEYFDYEDESISFTDYDEQGKRIEYSRFEGISIQELQAINKKVEELGWKG